MGLRSAHGNVEASLMSLAGERHVNPTGDFSGFVSREEQFSNELCPFCSVCGYSS